MKKLVFLWVCLFSLQSVTAQADNDKPIQVAQMPQAAQQFIKSHLADSKVALAKVENDFLYKSYEVIFTNGNKVEFDRKGNWTEVDCTHTAVPAAVVPAGIQRYLTDIYPDAKVLKMERDNRGEIEVKLSNKKELTFDKNNMLVDIDD